MNKWMQLTLFSFVVITMSFFGASDSFAAKKAKMAKTKPGNYTSYDMGVVKGLAGRWSENKCETDYYSINNKGRLALHTKKGKKFKRTQLGQYSKKAKAIQVSVKEGAGKRTAQVAFNVQEGGSLGLAFMKNQIVKKDKSVEKLSDAPIVLAKCERAAKKKRGAKKAAEKKM